MHRAVRLGPASASESYLRIDRVLEAARASGADAIHPGYGFLSENAAFASACKAAGIVFIGPSAEAIAAMGDKILAKRVAESAGVPVVPGSHGILTNPERAAEVAEEIGYPVLIKAVHGGGGSRGSKASGRLSRIT